MPDYTMRVYDAVCQRIPCNVHGWQIARIEKRVLRKHAPSRAREWENKAIPMELPE
ncbi:MAG: hypothetical protein KGI54_17220 [Pseudomonadota bacterium]|nr:hypothetical protein [Pseudomonadota bacterium]